MRTILTRLVTPLLLVAAFINTAWAADPEAGEALYQSRGCVGCHGPEGESSIPEMYPNLAERDADYITEQLTAFRDGSRQNPMMSPMASGLSDEDIANLAAYLGSE